MEHPSSEEKEALEVQLVVPDQPSRPRTAVFVPMPPSLFANKLYEMLMLSDVSQRNRRPNGQKDEEGPDASRAPVCGFSPSGYAFMVFDPAAFASDVLPQVILFR